MSTADSPNCVTKKKSKRAILKTWLHRPELSTDETDDILPLNSGDLESFVMPNTFSIRSKGQSPSEIYESKITQKPLNVANERSLSGNRISIKLKLTNNGNKPPEELDDKKYQSLSRRKLGELKETLRTNLDRITHNRGKVSVVKNNCLDNDDSIAIESTIDTMRTTESEAQGKSSCYQSFRTNPKDLSILFDYAMNTSFGDLQNVNDKTKESVSKSPNLFKRLVYEDAVKEDVLEEVTDQIKSVNDDIPSLFRYQSSSGDSTSLYDWDHESGDSDVLGSAGNYSDDYDANHNSIPAMVNVSSVLMGNTSQRSMKRLHAAEDEQNSKRQRFNLEYDSIFQPPPSESLPSASSSYSEQVNPGEISSLPDNNDCNERNELKLVRDIEAACDIQEKTNAENEDDEAITENISYPSGELSNFLSKTKVITVERSDKSSTVPSLVIDDKSTSTSRITSDSSQVYTIPTFRNETKRLNIANIITSLRNRSVGTIRSTYRHHGGMNRSVSYRDNHFYDTLPDKYFTNDQNEENENNVDSDDDGNYYDVTCESDKFYNSIKSIEPGYYNRSMNSYTINNESNSVRFNDESKLFIYTPKRKGPGTLRNDQILLQQNNLDSGGAFELKSILKTKDHNKIDVENARAICCDSVNVKSFMKALNDYEEKRLDDDRNNAISREKQLNRYYSKEIIYGNETVVVHDQSF